MDYSHLSDTPADLFLSSIVVVSDDTIHNISPVYLFFLFLEREGRLMFNFYTFVYF